MFYVNVFSYTEFYMNFPILFYNDYVILLIHKLKISYYVFSQTGRNKTFTLSFLHSFLTIFFLFSLPLEFKDYTTFLVIIFSIPPQHLVRPYLKCEVFFFSSRKCLWFLLTYMFSHRNPIV